MQKLKSAVPLHITHVLAVFFFFFFKSKFCKENIFEVQLQNVTGNKRTENL